MRDDLSKEGYSKEEAYFNKLNRELIEKLKKEEEFLKTEEAKKSDPPEKVEQSGEISL